MNYEELFKRKLRHHGYKFTPARQMVFEEILKTEGVTESILADTLSDTTDRSTVYRTVALLESLHLVTRIWNGWKSSLEVSDAFISHHHHITCSKCGMVRRLESNQLEDELTRVVSKYGFTTLAHTLEFVGLCKECSNN
jgi:Fur family ferric uptake transcriptional regulator